MKLKVICTFHTAYAEITKKIIHRKIVYLVQLHA